MRRNRRQPPDGACFFLLAGGSYLALFINASCIARCTMAIDKHANNACKYLSIHYTAMFQEGHFIRTILVGFDCLLMRNGRLVGRTTGHSLQTYSFCLIQLV